MRRRRNVTPKRILRRPSSLLASVDAAARDLPRSAVVAMAVRQVRELRAEGMTREEIVDYADELLAIAADGAKRLGGGTTATNMDAARALYAEAIGFVMAEETVGSDA